MAALDKMRTQLRRALRIPEESAHNVSTLVDGVKGRLAAERVHDFPGPTLPVHHGDAPEARRLNRCNAEVLEPFGEFVGVHPESCGVDQHGRPPVERRQVGATDVGVEGAGKATGEALQLMEPIPSFWARVDRTGQGQLHAFDAVLQHTTERFDHDVLPLVVPTREESSRRSGWSGAPAKGAPPWRRTTWHGAGSAVLVGRQPVVADEAVDVASDEIRIGPDLVVAGEQVPVFLDDWSGTQNGN